MIIHRKVGMIFSIMRLQNTSSFLHTPKFNILTYCYSKLIGDLLFKTKLKLI